jgi:GTPase SAR1 family protein
LHLLGIVLNFAEDPNLQDTSVLKPEWVTGGVYRILNDNRLITKHKGMLKWQDLPRILKPKNKSDLDCYKKNEDKRIIIEMMKKFEMCFPIDSNPQNPIYLIPELLYEDEPDTGTWDNPLNFEYHYKILFSSVISRFIVKMHGVIPTETYWRTGVILSFSTVNRAYIKADLADAKIFIRIDGNLNTRRSSLAAIRNTFESIHRSISALEVDQRVPLPDNPKVTVPYDHLCNLERDGNLYFIPYGTRQSYEVRSLLEGIEERRSRSKDDLREREPYSDRQPPVTVIINNSNQQANIMTESEKPQPQNTPKSPDFQIPSVITASMSFVFIVLTTAFLVLTFAGILKLEQFVIAMFSIILMIVIGVIFVLKVTGQMEGKSFEKVILSVLKQLTLYDTLLSKIGDIIGKFKK